MLCEYEIKTIYYNLHITNKQKNVDQNVSPYPA